MKRDFPLNTLANVQTPSNFATQNYSVAIELAIIHGGETNA